MRKHFYALGRLKSGEMNKTETAYRNHLELLKQAGEILWYKFEGIQFRLAKNTTYLPDFVVMLKDGEMQIHEVKGSPAIFRDDAKVKVKVTAEEFPFRLFVCYPLPKKLGGGWKLEEY